jgi:hypothetical protein
MNNIGGGFGSGFEDNNNVRKSGLFIESPNTQNGLDSGFQRQNKQQMKQQMGGGIMGIENVITLRVYISINEDFSNEVFKMLTQQLKHYYENENELVMNQSELPIIKFEGENLAYLDVRINYITRGKTY